MSHIKDAACARTNLHIFGAITSILEGGALCGGLGSDRVAARIIAMCQKEQQRLLATYDKAVAASQAAEERKS
ncbi:hypothetical protein [Pandoraea sputorum]|uniref:Uncharacterized protein n=1 Tax=Pandoraea sputorum TaxID=93222 RepID=A0A5E5BIR7_9BURK|nr:hypothetical protein [Pandoraea sputorum]VVE84935.1 hypothetical protein PSP31121_05002 [Pandoraea sputorum]VVE85166.1 hypothetical protein PSP31121_05112 [Pandoraea sputorum]